MSAYEDQHYIPRSYLKYFAFEGKITMRRRGALPHPAPISGVAKAKHLYSLTLPDGTRDASAEHTLDKFEGIAAECFNSLRRGGPIPRRGTDERHAIGLFLGLQRIRTPEDANQWLVPVNIAKRAGTDRPTPEDVRAYLRDVHLGIEPSEQEVQAAHSWVSATKAMGLPTKTEQLKLMFGLAMEVAPILENMNWTVEDCATPLFATCDRLPATWRAPSEEDQYKGVGIDGEVELWLPLDPQRLLVLRHTGTEGRAPVDAGRARFVNRHLAKHCFRAVFHDPRLDVGPDDMPMRDERLTLRFHEGPLVTDDGPTGDEVIHLWTAIRDDAWAEPETGDT